MWPYRSRHKGTKDLVIQAVTFMDPATGWFELKQTRRTISSRQTKEPTANLVEQSWLSRYLGQNLSPLIKVPSSRQTNFDDLLLRKENPNIKTIKTSSKQNPHQANAILERAVTWNNSWEHDMYFYQVQTLT
jgi:hypothetical protein